MPLSVLCSQKEHSVPNRVPPPAACLSEALSPRWVWGAYDSPSEFRGAVRLPERPSLSSQGVCYEQNPVSL